MVIYGRQRRHRFLMVPGVLAPIPHVAPRVWKAIWVYINHFPISGNNSRYREMLNKNPNGFPYLFSISRYRELFPDIGNLNSRYREINFRYREIINFPISGNDFRISGIDFPISGNVFDFPISGNQFPISENRHPTRQKQVTSPPCNTALPRPLSTTAPSNTGTIGDRHYDFSKSQRFIHTYMQNSISATNNNHTTDYFVQKYRNFWCWIDVLNDINKNSTLR